MGVGVVGQMWPEPISFLPVRECFFSYQISSAVPFPLMYDFL